MSNADRADRAQFALEWYADRAGADPNDEGFDTLARDLLADLMHFCEREGIDFEGNLEIARMHFDVELEEENQ